MGATRDSCTHLIVHGLVDLSNLVKAQVNYGECGREAVTKCIPKEGRITLQNPTMSIKEW